MWLAKISTSSYRCDMSSSQLVQHRLTKRRLLRRGAEDKKNIFLDSPVQFLRITLAVTGFSPGTMDYGDGFPAQRDFLNDLVEDFNLNELVDGDFDADLNQEVCNLHFYGLISLSGYCQRVFRALVVMTVLMPATFARLSRCQSV